MYRPTVRCSNAYKDYINDLFHATSLDRNQIIRAALFTAAHSELFQSLINQHKRKDVTLPEASWGKMDNYLWMEQDPEIQKRDVKVVPTIKKKPGGGISIQIGSRKQSV